jgi:NAD(P) transhydrogenase subunit alpha
MSGTNAISGISLVASLLAAGTNHLLSELLGFVAVTCATINVVGGFLITDRMLRMFQKKPSTSPVKSAASHAGAGS